MLSGLSGTTELDLLVAPQTSVWTAPVSGAIALRDLAVLGAFNATMPLPLGLVEGASQSVAI